MIDVSFLEYRVGVIYDMHARHVPLSLRDFDTWRGEIRSYLYIGVISKALYLGLIDRLNDMLKW